MRYIKRITAIVLIFAAVITLMTCCSRPATLDTDPDSVQAIQPRLRIISSYSKSSICPGGIETIAYDVETGVMYLIIYGHHIYGITILADADGKPLLYTSYRSEH